MSTRSSRWLHRVRVVLTLLVGLVFLVAPATLLTGCAGPLDAAVRTANSVRGIGEAGASFLQRECIEEAPRAATRADVAALERVCRPAARAYRTVRASHLALLAAILAVSSGKSGEDTLGPAVFLAVEAASELARAVQGGGEP